MGDRLDLAICIEGLQGHLSSVLLRRAFARIGTLSGILLALSDLSIM
jgi:hypothetical protein